MPALNFKKQFAPLVESGQKRQTIRSTRKRPFKVGDTLYLYTGMRTKNCRKLGEETCTRVEPILITKQSPAHYPTYLFNGQFLTQGEVELFAFSDGFRGSDPGLEMYQFFKQNLPFTGQVIHW